MTNIEVMDKVDKYQYEFALERIEELLPMVTDHTAKNDRKAIELSLMSDIVIAYEKDHFPFEKCNFALLITHNK